MQPHITLSDALVKYLSGKSYDGVLVDVAECSSCGGALAEVFARAAKNKELDRLVDNGARCFEVEGFKIVLGHRLLRVSAEVSFDIRNLFFVQDVTVSGIRL